MRYPGGKGGAGVYQTIINNIPPHDTYIETHLGGGNILERKRPAARSVGIDLDPGEPAELGKNRTLRFSELPQRPEFPVFQLAALPPNVIAGQVDVLPAQWRKVLQ